MNYDSDSLSAADQLLIDLLKLDSTNGINPEKPVIDHIRALLNAEGILTELYWKDPERPNLLAVLPGENKNVEKSGANTALLLYGHADVVSTQGQKWSCPPFGGQVKDGFIWGRGALDMKGQLSMFIRTMLEIKRRGTKLPFDLKLLVVSDEEGTAEWGMDFLVTEHPEIFAGVKYALGEIGGFSITMSGKKFYPVMIAEKQCAVLKITARGEGGHGSFSHRNTAMERLCGAVKKLSESTLPVRITEPVKIMIESMAKAMGGASAAALRLLLRPLATDKVLKMTKGQLDLFVPLLHNNINVTLIQGGTAINVIPSEVSCLCDFRLVPGCTIEEGVRDVRKIIGDDFEIEVTEYVKGADQLDLNLLQDLFEALQRKDPAGLPIPFVISGVTDGRFLSQLGIQTYGFTPMELPKNFDFSALIHSADERIPLGAVDFGTEVLIDFIMHYNGIVK